MQMPWVGAQAKIPALEKQVDELKYILSYSDIQDNLVYVTSCHKEIHT